MQLLCFGTEPCTTLGAQFTDSGVSDVPGVVGTQTSTCCSSDGAEEEEEGGIWEPEEKGKGVKWVSWPAANVALTHSL